MLGSAQHNYGHWTSLKPPCGSFHHWLRTDTMSPSRSMRRLHCAEFPGTIIAYGSKHCLRRYLQCGAPKRHNLVNNPIFHNGYWPTISPSETVVMFTNWTNGGPTLQSIGIVICICVYIYICTYIKYAKIREINHTLPTYYVYVYIYICTSW